MAALPPVSHRAWRYVAFGIVGLLGVVLIASHFTGTKPSSPVSVVNGASNTGTVDSRDGHPAVAHDGSGAADSGAARSDTTETGSTTSGVQILNQRRTH